MQVVNRLPRCAAAVEDEPVAGFADAFLLRDFVGCKEHFAKELCVTFIELGDRFNVLARHDEHVRRRLGSNVAKRHDQIAFVNELRRQTPIDNAAKNALHLSPHFFVTVTHAHQPLLPLRLVMADQTGLASA